MYECDTGVGIKTGFKKPHVWVNFLNTRSLLLGAVVGIKGNAYGSMFGCMWA